MPPSTLRNLTTVIAVAAGLLTACGASHNPTPIVVTPPPITPRPAKYHCSYALQDILEAQRLLSPVSWGCVKAGSVDPACVAEVANKALEKLTDPTERLNFQAYVWCINLKCHNPAGAGWINDDCAETASATICERQLILCEGE